MVKKSRLVLPMTRLIYLLLLLLYSPESSESKVNQFGCSFDDKDFNIYKKNSGKAEFGEIDPGNIMNFENLKSYEKFIVKITNIYSEFFEFGLTYDSLSSYLRFYKTYKAVKDCKGFKDIPSFYRDYRAVINNEYEPGGNMITLMMKLVDQIPRLKFSSYFVTRSNVSNEELLKDMDSTSVTLPKFFQHEQIAGVIKFRKLGSIGYILLDPEIGADKPVVFMQDNQNATTDDDISNINNIEFRILDPKPKLDKPISDSQYITAKVNNGSNWMYLYYYRKTFCSMVDTTMKPSLLKFKHSREKRNGQGVTVASLIGHVRMFEPVKPSWGTVYDVKLFLQEGKPEMSEIPMMVDPKTELKDKGFKDKLCKNFGLKENNECLSYWAKQIELLQAIYVDFTFLTQCKYTLEQLDNARSQVSWVPIEIEGENDIEGKNETEGENFDELAMGSSSTESRRLYITLKLAQQYKCNKNGYG